jgi:general secretion pathway protein G
MGRNRRSASDRRAEGCAGFTLIEVMVVLALIAALMAIAFPQFVRLYSRVKVAFERDEIERQLFELPEKVRAAGRAGVLADPSAPSVGATADRAGEIGFEDPQRLHLDLPQDWQLTIPKPIFYHFTGACDGGDLFLSLPPLTLHYVLSAPLCRPRLADDR